MKLGAAFLEDRDGAAAIVIAFMTPILIGGLAFGAEVGAWEMTKRRIQNAADTAAYAAGTQVRAGYDATTTTNAALVVATDSGYKSGAAGITVESPPTSAPIAVDGTDPNGDSRFVHVVLTETVQRNFTRYFASDNTIDIVSESVARVENGRPACVLALAPNVSGAVSAGALFFRRSTDLLTTTHQTAIDNCRL
ncbi:MAG: pilus assembly protein TadG-related protein [Parvularculaceae bacterium]